MTSPKKISGKSPWIIIRINDSFLYVNDEPYNIFVLMDALSAHVYGHVIARAAEEAPHASDVRELFKKALDENGKKPDTLIIPDNSRSGAVFRQTADEFRLTVESIPLEELSPIIGPLLKAFAEMDDD